MRRNSTATITSIRPGELTKAGPLRVGFQNRYLTNWRQGSQRQESCLYRTIGQGDLDF
jgi:hypothetical protein